MKKLRVRIEGVSPLLMHRFVMEDKIGKSTKKNQKQTEDDVEQSLYLDENKKLTQPAEHIRQCLKRAGAKFQIKGQGKTTYKNVIGGGEVLIEPESIVHEIQDWVVDQRPVVIQGKNRIIRSRPRLDKWALEFDVIYFEDEIPKEVLNEIFVYAGRRVGIGDYRPDKSGPFGKFIVTTFEGIKGYHGVAP